VVCTSDNVLDNKETDPHVWLSFDNAKAQLGAICTALSEKDSENAPDYKARLDEYISKLDALKSEYENAGLSGKKIFVTHGAYGYLCSDLGMEQIALEGISGESDPSPAQMAKVVDEIKAEGAKCIFYDPLEGDKIALAVAQETGIEALPLYTFEGDSENRDYLTIMTLNLEQLKKAL
ncbi:MAG: zinc ABC transporter substrate-binding protein, partial [Clostridia bacterium]|nr:zinc ABC transporter substrate-binding protein [Clostridia bacterium]